MIFHSAILKSLIQPIWFKHKQVKAEHNQMSRQIPNESISISLSRVTYHHIFQSFKIFRDDVNITTKKELTKKIILNDRMWNFLMFD